MSLKIGNTFVLSKGPDVQFTAQGYQGGSIGIRGRVRSGENVSLAETQLYHLRDGSIQDIEIQTDDGKFLTGSYKINELNWKKERQDNGNYELVFNIGLQKNAL